MKTGPRVRGGDAGFFNPAHASAVQVLGEAGTDYLSRLAAPGLRALAKELARGGLKSLLIARGARTDPQLWAAAGISCEARDEPAHEIVHALRVDAALAAPQATAHGVLMQVHGAGVLIEGAPGAGKSLLALDLISRGHALVADDAIELRRPAAGIVTGRSPAVLEGYLASRDLGVVDVLRMHGSASLRRQARVDLVIGLGARRRALTAAQLLQGRRSTRRLLGVAVPLLSLPRHPELARRGHNLAALVEAAALDARLRLDGIEADAALGRRQARALKKK